jgi:pilus assembly protein FimV
MVSGKITLALLAFAASGAASALGFGDFRSQVILGQPLNLAVPVTLADGETLGAECASAEVTSGDVRLPAGSVRVRVTQGRDNSEAVIRVSSSVPIEEPVVNVSVSAGCPARITRSMVLLADPPIVSPTVAAVPAAEAPRPAATPRPEPTRPAVATTDGSTPPRATRPAQPPRARATTVAPAAPRAVTSAPAAAPIERPATRVAAAPRPASAPRSEGRPRLRLDEGQVNVTQAAVQAAEAQASAAREAAALAEAAASAAQARAAALETEMARLRADAKAQTDALLALRQQLALDQAQRQQQAWVLPLLLAVTAALAIVAGWLAWRLRSQAQVAPQREVWWDKASPASRHGEDEDSSYRSSTSQVSSSRIPSAPAPLTSAPEPAREAQTDLDPRVAPPTVAAPVAVTIPPLPPRSAMAEEASRAMSVDEQIDLEQQADFFIALGHDESAIDLLMAHLRSTGGGTPLPFLKLLEIHRRRGDREAYERTRVRFNQRFNSVAPDWASDPRAGRALEDYPLVLGRVQHTWAQPLDAMAELEALLFRRGAGAELFDLPAYQELLFLYQLSRDLHQADQPDADVDVLLPIGGAVAATAEGSITLRPEFSSGEVVSLDLDLTTDTGKLAEAAPAQSKLELDLSGDTLPPADDGKDIWSADPSNRRRE